jgi:membrane-associated phospholipid phosphatase
MSGSEKVGNLLSLISPLLHLVPLVNVFITSDLAVYLKHNGPVIGGLVVLYTLLMSSRVILGHVASKYPDTVSILKRPQNARDCSNFNSGGVGTDPWIGMPSGHVMTTAFILTMYGLNTPHLKNSKIYWVISLGLVVLVAIGRILKECHTVSQCVVGAICGIGLAIVTLYVTNATFK